ncbi:Vacuolar protein sorting-associated protein 17 [Mycoemilia scoparia]|uniref:Vacuolar protein sorting-associated protein 17 n=1 Tax=Mycoemilia scoparia TaxID=417184 RepID=A0A9W8DLG2_9FUNG|nr:Vacuolar protein sorting-associated protein 17 [Mycoemilia scoparia]
MNETGQNYNDSNYSSLPKEDSIEGNGFQSSAQVSEGDVVNVPRSNRTTPLTFESHKNTGAIIHPAVSSGFTTTATNNNNDSRGYGTAATGANHENNQKNYSLDFVLSKDVDHSKKLPIFKFDTSLPAFKQRKYIGKERSQLEFERLASHLRNTYPECLVLCLPQCDATSKYTPNYQNDDIVIHYLQRWLNWIASHDVIKNDYELRSFVEATFAFNPAMNTVSNHSTSSGFGGAGSGRALSASSSPGPPSSGGFFSWAIPSRPRGLTGSSSAPSPEDMYFDDTSSNLKRFENNLWGCVQWSGRVTRRQNYLAKEMLNLSEKLKQVGNSEVDPKLSRCFQRVGKCVNTLGLVCGKEVDRIGSRAVYVFNTYLVTSNGVKEIVGTRHGVFKDHEAAAKKLEQKKQAVAVLRASSTINPDRVNHILREMDQAKDDEAVKRQRMERLNRVLRADLEKFDKEREQDIQKQLEYIARAQMSVENTLLYECRAALRAIKS